MSENPLYDRLCAFEGREDGPGRVAEDPVGMAVIRRWVEAFGDENPIDRDEMAAHDAGRTGIVAPPAMLSIFTTRGDRETLAQASGVATPLFQLLTEEGLITPGVSLAHDYEADIAR